MKRLNRWLKENFKWDYDTETEGCYVLWFALASFLTLFVGQFVFHSVETLFQVFCLGVTFVPPLVLGIVALARKERFNPKYWFLGVKGTVMGGLLACVLLFAIRGLLYVLNYIFG